MTWTTRALEPGDRAAWERLFTGYCTFYEREWSGELLDTVWSWIHDTGDVIAIVAVPETGDGDPQGLAHLRPWVRPLRGQVCGYLDDLYVEPAHRGSGVVDTLFEAIDALAKDKGWPIVRWTTADDNYRARTAYDRVATRTGWITYEMTMR
jgi:GNAT superfamily N-acetyltransferase